MQDCINIYNGGVLEAVIDQAIDADLSDRLSGELTLAFTTKAGRIPVITAETEIEFRGQYYRAVQVQSSIADGAFLISVSCEQESIALVDDAMDLFDYEGTADGALAELLAGTGITATAEYSGTIHVRQENTNRRAVLTEIRGICGAETEYDGHTIRLVGRRGLETRYAAGWGSEQTVTQTGTGGVWTDRLYSGYTFDGRTAEFTMTGTFAEITDNGQIAQLFAEYPYVRVSSTQIYRITGVTTAESDAGAVYYRFLYLPSVSDTAVPALDTLFQQSALVRTEDLRNGTESYEIDGWEPDGLQVGDTVVLLSGRLGISVQKRIVGMSYNPFHSTSVRLEVGDFVPDILDSYQEVLADSTSAAAKAETAEDAAREALGKAEDSVQRGELSAAIDTYINEETGRASIVAALKGTYVEAGTLAGYTKKTELSAEIGAYIDTQEGTARIVQSLSGTYVTADTLGNFVKKTELSAEIGAYIDTQEGTARIVTAASGTFQKKADMTGYVTTSALNTSISQYIDGSIGKAQILSLVSGTYATKSELAGYATTSAVSKLSQTVTDVQADITLSTVYSNNTIGTNVQALLQLVSNANSSSIKLKADKIDFAGFTTFVRASDLGASGSTSIDGARITTGTISAERIDTTAITLSDVYGKGTYKDYLMITSSGHYMYIGSDITVTKGVYESIDIRSGTLGFGNTSVRGLVIDHPNRVFRPNASTTSGTYDLGSLTYPWGSLYVSKLYIDGTELATGGAANTDRIYAGTTTTTKYLQLNTGCNLVPYPSTTAFYLGSSSAPFRALYVGSGTSYYWTLDADGLIPSYKTTSYFNIGSSSKPVSTIYATAIYLNGTALSAAGNASGNLAGTAVKLGGSSSYYIQATTSRQLCPNTSSSYYAFYLGTSSYYWHYAYIGSVSASIGSSASSKLGFFGTTPAARQTVASTATVATLITALKKYGLIY